MFFWFAGEPHHQVTQLLAFQQEAALVDALERLLGDADLRARLGANARRLAAERFSLEAMGAALMGLYQRVLAREETGQ